MITGRIPSHGTADNEKSNMNFDLRRELERFCYRLKDCDPAGSLHRPEPIFSYGIFCKGSIYRQQGRSQHSSASAYLTKIVNLDESDARRVIHAPHNRGVIGGR